jgi:hypothetical protein
MVSYGVHWKASGCPPEGRSQTRLNEYLRTLKQQNFSDSVFAVKDSLAVDFVPSSIKEDKAQLELMYSFTCLCPTLALITFNISEWARMVQ